MIVIMAGLPGTGKTTLARLLAERCSGRVVSKDDIRHAIFATGEVEYSTRQDDFCLQVMLQIAEYLFRRDREMKVFLDGRTFSRMYQIENVVNASSAMHQSWRILECVCNDEVVKCRLQEQAAQERHPARNRNFELYREVKARYEAITLPKTVIDTNEEVAVCLDRALAVLR
jgi:predicted kinase